MGTEGQIPNNGLFSRCRQSLQRNGYIGHIPEWKGKERNVIKVSSLQAHEL